MHDDSACSFFFVDFDNRGNFTQLENLLGSGCREEVHRASDNASPASLMTYAEPSAVVALEIFVEQNVITPVRVVKIGFMSSWLPVRFPSGKKSGSNLRRCRKELA